MPDPSTRPRRPRTVFGRASLTEATRLADVLRKETVGGALLLVGAVLALVWANSPLGDSYFSLRDLTVGPHSLHLDLSLETWAADGLLAVFFFVVGLELKREFVAGDLRDPSRAALPILAAVGGVVVPALVFVAVTRIGGADAGALQGWAVPTATDIAFALAVLAIIGTHLPNGLRTFLLTLAVVDDLIAVTIIAVVYTESVDVLPLALAVVPLLLFGVAVQRRIRSFWLLVPLAVLTWALVHASGVHATVAGVLLGFAVPVIRSRAAGGPEAGPGLAEHFEHLLRPLSAGVAVPVFAFFAAGVDVGGPSGLRASLSDPIALGVVAGLVVGKTVGVFGTTYLVSRFTHASLDDDLAWLDVLGLSMLAGIGFTVSLLIGDLAFGAGSTADDHVKVGILVGSLVAALLAGGLMRARDRTYRRIAQREATGSEDTVPEDVPGL